MNRFSPWTSGMLRALKHVGSGKFLTDRVIESPRCRRQLAVGSWQLAVGSYQNLIADRCTLPLLIIYKFTTTNT